MGLGRSVTGAALFIGAALFNQAEQFV